VCLLEARPLTGRHHQIRVHLRSAGTPILFDPLYGKGRMPEALAGAPCARLALHARRIDVPAPHGGGRVVVEAPLPPDLAALVGVARRPGPRRGGRRLTPPSSGALPPVGHAGEEVAAVELVR
jgi:hypothetical protein